MIKRGETESPLSPVTNEVTRGRARKAWIVNVWHYTIQNCPLDGYFLTIVSLIDYIK